MTVKIIVRPIKDYGWNPSKCIFENGRYLKSIVDESIISINENINVTNNIPANDTNALATNVRIIPAFFKFTPFL